VPYKDPEKRRQFQREYKRRQRQTLKKIKPFLGFRAYVCPRFPGLGVGLAHVDGGLLITNRPAVQAQVERHPEYGRHIFPLALDLTGPILEEE